MPALSGPSRGAAPGPRGLDSRGPARPRRSFAWPQPLIFIPRACSHASATLGCRRFSCWRLRSPWKTAGGSSRCVGSGLQTDLLRRSLSSTHLAHGLAGARWHHKVPCQLSCHLYSPSSRIISTGKAMCVTSPTPRDPRDSSLPSCRCPAPDPAGRRSPSSAQCTLQ